LEAGYRAQERFISNVAHDLKTSIAVMLTESQVFRSDNVSLEEVDEYRQSMISEMKRLGGLVEGFLTLARADQGDALARMRDVSVVDVLMEAVAECDSEASHLEVRLVTIVQGDESSPGEVELRADADLLRAMLANLIRNAVRHSPAGEVVDIRLAQHEEWTVFSVRDRGPGVPDDLREVIFDRFVQAPGDQPRAAGTGIGLAIARSVAEMHRGRVQNCDDGGCTFTVRLPGRSARADAVEEPPA
jgi:signal transduction histidine kinase